VQVHKEQAKQAIADLVARFAEQIDSYKHGDYNETQTRRDFIDPFFKALGWDVDNQNAYAEAYREVIHEDKIKIGSATKAPDYSFRLAGGKRLFFVEAKKPSVAVKDDIQPAYQVRRYGWSAKMPISIITDFEEFSVYDCTKRPHPGDKASVARVKYLTYNEYSNEFDFLWDTFSKERVLKGSFDKFVQSDTNKKGTTTVDKEFLLSLDSWRTDLAVNLSKNNQQLDEDELNFAVQQTIDRIIFLRIAEDRNIEPYGSLKDAVKQGDFYKNLYHLFTRADEKYNSGLFDLQKDKISRQLAIENKTLKKIIHELYYPESPYEFSVLSVEILGSAYEQFLGKTIHVEAGKRAKIEEKPEVRKAGGVYYTPQYIVDYIVQNTVGKMIAGKSPKEIEKIKIVDPACGSGSFLIGAYQHLLDYHKDYYTKSGVKTGKKESPLTPEGMLTASEKKRILLNNIFGVDIDTNAVEVTKLSLLLKCMEGESKNSIEQQYKLWNERVLPTLDDNIKSGNSLIDTDYYDTQLDFGFERKIKPFNWQKAFPAVFNDSHSRGSGNPLSYKSGFDIVIGNPPYVRIQTLNESSIESVKYFHSKYFTGGSNNFDLYILFIEKGMQLLNQIGLLGFIVPNKFFNTDYGLRLRELLTNRSALNHIVDFQHHQVFENATTYCCLLFLNGEPTKQFTYKNAEPSIDSINGKAIRTFESAKYNSDTWSFYDDAESSIVFKLQNTATKLLDIPSFISRGSSSGNDNVFILKKGKGSDYINGFDEVIELENDILRIPIFATDFNRYLFKYDSPYRLIFPYKISNNNVSLIEETELKKEFPKTYKYLLAHKNTLLKRKQFSAWYGYSAARNLALHSNANILIPLLANKGLFALTPTDMERYTLMASGGFSITLNNQDSFDKYVLGLINSNLLFWYLNKISNVFNGGWITCTKQYFGQIPILANNLSGSALILKDVIVKNVEALLQLNKEKQSATLQTKTEQIQTRIDYHEDKINQAVYQLYGLTDEEIKIIEDTVKK
jgi:adenine-specific DNA-methyltransferase